MPMQPYRTGERRAGGTLIVALALLAGCDRGASPPTPPPAAASAPAPAPLEAKPTFTLILTWMYGMQPPQTTQTVFHDEAACDQARDAALAEGRRLALEAIGDPAAAAPASAPPPVRRYIGSALLPGDDAPSAQGRAVQSAPPKVAAICAATSGP